jgi:hypothetical protein
MKPPIAGIMVFCSTTGTHGENLHGGALSIIGDVLNNAVPRPAIGAIEEGVEISAVLGGEELTEAIGTCRQVGGDQGRAFRA